MTCSWFLGWSVFVTVWWVVLAAALADDDECSLLCFGFADVLLLLFVPAAVVWFVGLLVLHVVLRARARKAEVQEHA